jgi:hypothetical protein
VQVSVRGQHRQQCVRRSWAYPPASRQNPRKYKRGQGCRIDMLVSSTLAQLQYQYDTPCITMRL